MIKSEEYHAQVVDILINFPTSSKASKS